jgi:fumarylpyruvate hydrolase
MTMNLAFEPEPIPTVAIFGSELRFPVRQIFCVGRNYAAHAREMGRDPEREPPFFFMKPADTVVDHGTTIPYPPQTTDFQHEGELVVAIGLGGTEIAESAALEHIWGYGCGNDLTRRDLQTKAKELGRPWDWGKGFDRSAVIGPIHPVAARGHLAAGEISVSVNGKPRQHGDLADMIWSVPEIIAILSRSMELKRGDLIMTGTPAGVGPLVPGDRCDVTIETLGTLTTMIAGPD